MPSSLLRLLPLAILQLVRRSIGQIVDNSTSVEASALLVVPDCATNCLEAFISSNYAQSTCTNNLDLACLCTHNTPSGLTLGEAALRCLLSSCPSDNLINATTVTNICSGVSDAIAGTIGTLTVTMTTTNVVSLSAFTSAANSITSPLPSSIFVPTSSISISTIVSETGSPSISPSIVSATFPQPSSTTSPIPTAVSILSSTTPSTSATFVSSTTTTPSSMSSSTSTTFTQPAAQSTSSATAVSPTVERQGVLTTGQIVGISIAGVATALLAIGLLLLFCCLRKRKRQRRFSTQWAMANERQPQRPSTPPQDPGHVGTTFANPADVTIGHGQRYYASRPVEERRRSFWRKSIKPEDIGVAVSPEIAQHALPDTPDSYSSQRTASQLLPAMPAYALWPAPLRLSRQLQKSKDQRPESTATVFEEDTGRSTTFHKAVTVPYEGMELDLRKEKTQRSVSPTPRARNQMAADPRAQMYAIERAQAQAKRSQIPLTPVYDNGNPTPVYGRGAFGGAIPGSSDAAIPMVPPVYRPSTFASAYTQPQQPDYYNTMYQQYGQNPFTIPTLTQEPQNSHNTAYRQLTTAPINHRTSASSNRRNPRDSASSDVTNFETDEDTTPEQELDKRLKPSLLSPVMESPRRFPPQETSPIKDLQYPRVPRPAAVSRQAEKPSRPRAALQVDTTGPPPRMELPSRDQLVRNERSFLQSESTSSGPSVLATWRRAPGLTLNSDAGNRAPGPTRWPEQQKQKPKLLLDTSGSGVENGDRDTVGLTPTRRGRDLYLTVH